MAPDQQQVEVVPPAVRVVVQLRRPRAPGLRLALEIPEKLFTVLQQVVQQGAVGAVLQNLRRWPGVRFLPLELDSRGELCPRGFDHPVISRTDGQKGSSIQFQFHP
jgi:hypothetical protein